MAELLACPTCGCEQSEPHCANAACTMIRCVRCRAFGEPDGSKWVEALKPKVQIAPRPDRPDCPQRPAAAYFDVANLLGERHFHHRPPTVGIRVMVGSTTDGDVTQWDVDPDTAERIVRMVRSRADLRCSTVGCDYRQRTA